MLLSRGQTISLDRLAEVVWQGSPPAKAAGGLHSYLSNLRRRLEPAGPPRGRDRIIIREHTGYRLAVEPEQIDVHLFEQMLNEGRRLLGNGQFAESDKRISECLGLWRGSPYQEISGCPFATQETVRLDELRLVALETWYEAKLAQDLDLDLAAAELEALVARLPTRENLARLLMSTLCRIGRQADSVKVYDRTRKALAEELGLAPNIELQRLFADVLRQDAEGCSCESVSQDLVSDNPLLEREEVMAALTGLADRAAHGRGQFVVVKGEAGVGRSRLLRELEARLTAAGTEVVWGLCGAPNFSPWTQVLRQLARARPPDGRRPLAVLLDDLHTCDTSSIDLLRQLWFSLRDTPLLLVATIREPNGSWQNMVWDSATVLRLKALSPAAVTALLATVTSTETADAVGPALRARTGGIPFYVTQLLSLVDARSVVSKAAVEAVLLTAVPDEVASMVKSCLDGLDDGTRQLLWAAAVLGERIDPTLLRETLEFTEGINRQLDRAVASGLLREDYDAGGYRFTHPILGEALYREVSGCIRTGLHARIGALLDAHPQIRVEDPVRIANHFWQARTMTDTSVVLHHAMRAAKHSKRRLAYADAETWSRRAVELVRTLPNGRAETALQVRLLGELGQISLTRCGSGVPDVESAFIAALALGDENQIPPSPAVLWGLCSLYFVTGRLSEAMPVCARLMEASRETGDTAALLGASYGRGVVSYLSGWPEAAAHELVWVSELADRLFDNRGGDHLAQVFQWCDPRISCRSIAAIAHWALGDREAASRLCGEALALSGIHGSVDHLQARYFDAVAASFEGDADRALASSTTGLELASRTDAPLWRAMIGGCHGWSLARKGKASAPEALWRLRDSVSMLRRHKAVMFLPLHRAYLADARLMAGDEDGAREEIRQAREEVRGFGLEYHLHPSFPFRHLYELGDPSTRRKLPGGSC